MQHRADLAILVYGRLMITIWYYLTSCWSVFSGVLSPAKQAAVLWNIILIRFSSTFIFADEDLVLYDIMLIWFIWCNIACWSRSSVYKTSSWSGSSSITSPADKNPVLYTIMRMRLSLYKVFCDQTLVLYDFIPIRFLWYKVSCWSESNVAFHHADAVSSGIKYPADQDPVLYNIMLIRFYL